MIVRDAGTTESSGNVEHETDLFTLSLGALGEREIMTLTLHPLPTGEGEYALPITQGALES
jgi:hypothetical protein